MQLQRMLQLLWFGLVGQQLVRVSWDEGCSGSDARAPFEIPLRIAVLGRRWRTSVQRAANKYPRGVVALRLVETVDDLEADPPPHILVVDSGDISAVRSEYFSAASSSDGLPALIISPGVWWQIAGAATRIPRGAALLLAPRGDFRKFFAALIEQIAADFPLDLAVAKAARHTLRGGRWLLLLDRYVNQALRMSDASEMLRQEFELQGVAVPLPRANLRGLAESRYLLEPQDLLEPRDQPLGGKRLPYPSPSSISAPAIADVVLLRAFYREDHKRIIDPGTTLQEGRRYIVQVHIGAQSKASILPRDREEIKAGVPPLIKPLLFEIVLQAKDFTLRSPMTRFLYLEPGNLSRPVRFVVKTPSRVGVAEMRLVVFSGNQMLQALDVRAKIADREYASGVKAAGATAEVSFAQMENLIGEEELPPRLATISVNRSEDTHSMLMKGSGTATGLDLSDSIVRDTLTNYRKILAEATTADGNVPRFPGFVTETPNDESQTYIRQLAELGEKMYNHLYDEERAAFFKQIRASKKDDDVLSIVRHDFGFAWPWSILYDFELPTRIVGIKPRVCFGLTETGQPCGHDGEEPVCCVRGFWGYRLQIEELHGASVNRQRLDTVADHSVPVMYVNASGTVAAEGIGPALAAFGGIPGRPPTLLADLWSPADRPAVAVLLGHLETEDRPGQPIGPRMIVGGTPSAPTQWLRESEVMTLVKQQGGWTPPNSVVMLLSCESAATSPATLSSLVLSFLKANASAVVGTECNAFAGLLARFGTELAEGMVRDQQSLGKVLRSTRRRLLHQGNPLAFVLNAIGIADLKVGKGRL